MTVTLVGAGPGDRRCLTLEAEAALLSASVIIGAKRLVDSLPARFTAERVAEALPEKIARLVGENPQWDSVCIVLSGDVGFYSGATQLELLLHHHHPQRVCGISTPQYFAARLKRPWQDFHLVSGHAAACDVLAEVRNHPAVLFLTGGETTAESIIAVLCNHGLHDAAVCVGENLSSPDERITAAAAGELRCTRFASLSVVLVENGIQPSIRSLACGLPDDLFIRGDAPMTKREVRAMILSLLQPKTESILYDIGAGTGSVAVEMALAARRGRVYAVERDTAGCRLIENNRLAFSVQNMHVIHGTAPKAILSLPAPEAAFIGGSGGNLDAIVETLINLSPRIRLVISAVSLETLHAAIACMDRLAVPAVEVCQIAATRTVRRGDYRMFQPQTPVFLISGGGDG